MLSAATRQTQIESNTMDKPVFDGAAFVSIDLDTGQVSTKEHDRLALVTKEILSLLAPSAELLSAAKGWGETHGKSLNRQVDPGQAGIESLASHLGGTLAVFGMGRVALELRHDALLFRVSEEEATFTDGMAMVISGFLSGYIEVVSGRSFQVLDLGAVGADRIFWAANPGAVDEVKRAIGRGTRPLEAIDALGMGGASC